MSLITRCPACGTMFRVVTDQLKVSQGWVRCGHCAEVFDGSAHLLPDETVALSPSALTPDDVPEPGQSFRSDSAQAPEAPDESKSDLAEPEWAPARSFADRVPLIQLRSGNDDAQDNAGDFDPASWKQAQRKRQQRESLPVPEHEPASPLTADTAPDRSALAPVASVDEYGFEPSGVADSEVEASDAENEVSFVRDARRKAFWKKPLIRWTLGLLSLLLLCALVLQWVLQEKDRLAALEPRLAPLLQTLCAHLRCEIRAPRHIESLMIDSSTFNKIGPDAYRLSFTLKNTGAVTLELPALEVTLTDTQDQALVRRVLTPAQFGASTNMLAAHSELAGVVTMKVSGGGDTAPSQPPAPLRVAGYRILAFYP